MQKLLPTMMGRVKSSGTWSLSNICSFEHIYIYYRKEKSCGCSWLTHKDRVWLCTRLIFHFFFFNPRGKFLIFNLFISLIFLFNFFSCKLNINYQGNTRLLFIRNLSNFNFQWTNTLYQIISSVLHSFFSCEGYKCNNSYDLK